MINRKAAILPFLIFSLGFGFLAVRLFFIQVWGHDKLNKKVNQISLRERSETPLRGSIFDRNGAVLALTSRVFTFFADPHACEGLNVIEAKLKKAGISFDKNKIAWNKSSSYIPILKNIDEETVKKIKLLGLPGTGFTPGFIRSYPEDKMACSVLGVVGVSGEGLSGIEFLRNKELFGDKYSFSSYRDGLGREISESTQETKDSTGSDIYLTIDRNLQFIAERELEAAYKTFRLKKGSIIIEDPNTGEILAMATVPSFDPANFSKAGDSLKNNAISDIFEPGSTFKIVAMAAALEEKIAKPSDQIFCENGKYIVYDHTIDDHERRGVLTLSQIIEYSSNIGMAKLGQKLGKEKLYQYIRQFGFSSKTGIDLPGEARGLLKEPDKWSGLSTAIISFGQEVGVTALQVVNAYSAIANGGTLLEPKIVKYTKHSTEIEDSEDRREIRRVASPEVVRQIQNMLVGVVDRGTGVYAKIPGYSVGGKTGTAQKKDPNTGEYSTSAYISSFCGIVPMSSPKLTILVVLDEPHGDYWGASTAAPVFKKVAMQALLRLKIPPDRVINQ